MADSKSSGQETANQSPGLVRLRGINWPPAVTEEALDALKTYDVWEDDVWVTTYPKSGSHWATEIVHLILVDGHEAQVNRSLQSPPAEFDQSQPRLSSTIHARKPAPQYSIMEGWKAPRIITTHLPEEMMPTQLYQGKGKVVFVIRNPKDTAVSEWHFMQARKYDPQYEDWDYFFQQFLKGETIYGSWFTYVLNFWSKHRYDKNFIFVKYEDMKQDTKGAVIQIADFLGKPLSEDAVDRVVQFCSMENMKTRFHSSTPSRAGEGSSKKMMGAPAILRKGIVGDWKSKFTVTQNEAFDALYEEKMAGSGLKIQFE